METDGPTERQPGERGERPALVSEVWTWSRLYGSGRLLEQRSAALSVHRDPMSRDRLVKPEAREWALVNAAYWAQQESRSLVLGDAARGCNAQRSVAEKRGGLLDDRREDCSLFLSPGHTSARLDTGDAFVW